jgi:hypothetical protein
MVEKLRNQPMSGRPIWLGPSAASEMPEWLPTILMFAPELMAISIWS